MDTNWILKGNDTFAGYTILERISSHHEGIREVYHVKDGETGEDAVMTVFNLSEGRYSSEEANGKSVPDVIDEVRFFKENPNLDCTPKFLECGIDSYEERSYAWMTQEYVEGESLHSLIRRLGNVDLGDALTIVKRIGRVCNSISRFTAGGGHYNISTDNIIVRYEDGEIADVRVIGFSNIGTSYFGKSSIDINSLDKRFRAPETSKGIFNRKSDVHSLGRVMLAMLAGYPRIIQTGKYTVDYGIGEINMDEVSMMEYYSAQWNKADECLSPALRLILRKATAISPRNRFNHMEKFLDFLSKFEKGNIKAQSVYENDSTNNCRNSNDNNNAVSYDRNCGSGSLIVKTKQKEERHSASRGIQHCGNKPNNIINALDSVAGMADLKALFRRDFIRIVKNPNVAKAYGIKPSNCTLLYGPQGCGKTFIAEKAAQESGLKYRIIRPSDLGSIYIHGAQQKIAETFADAEKKGPMILIFDEFDALVPKRSAEMNENQANEVNEMLTQLNNCAERGIYCLCTSNRPDRIDPAVMRKGRVDRSVFVSLPDFEARKEIFRLSLEDRPKDGSIDYDRLASATDNYTCSDIAYIVEETARTCFEETLDKDLTEPIAISQERLLAVVKATNPSVTETQRKEFLDLKAKMESREQDGARKKVGFAVF